MAPISHVQLVSHGTDRSRAVGKTRDRCIFYASPMRVIHDDSREGGGAVWLKEVRNATPTNEVRSEAIPPTRVRKLSPGALHGYELQSDGVCWHESLMRCRDGG